MTDPHELHNAYKKLPPEIIGAAALMGEDNRRASGLIVPKHLIDAELPSTKKTEVETGFEQKVVGAKLALAAQYEKYGAKVENFSLVETQDPDGEPVYTVVYSAANGLQLGDLKEDFGPRSSYNTVMTDYESHAVEISGQRVDTRNGMTEAVYMAMVANLKENGLPLPDSTDTKDNEVRTMTWLTGERAYTDNAWLAVVEVDGQVHLFLHPRNDNGQSVRFRPAVVITK